MFRTLPKLVVVLAVFAVGSVSVVFYFYTARKGYDLPTVADLDVPPTPPPMQFNAVEGPDYREYIGRAEALLRDQQRGAAIEAYRLAVRDCERRFGENSPTVLTALVPLGDLYLKEWRFEEAAQAFVRVFVLRRSVLGLAGALKDDSAGKLDALAKKAAGEAASLVRSRKFAAAEPLLRTVVLLRGQLAPPGYDALVEAMGLLADDLVVQGKYEELGKSAESLLHFQSRLYGPWDARLVKTYYFAGMSHRSAGRFAGAETNFRKAAEIEAKVNRESRSLGTLLTWLGDSLMGQGKYAEAEGPLLQGLAIRQKRLKPKDPEIAESFFALGSLRLRSGKPHEAEPLFRQVLAMVDTPTGGETLSTLEALEGLGAALTQSGRFVEAEPVLRRSLAGFERLDPQRPELADTLVTLVGLLREEGRLDEAAELGDRALPLVERAEAPGRARTARFLETLAQVAANRADFARAEAFYAQGLRIVRTLGPGTDPAGADQANANQANADRANADRASFAFRVARLYAAEGKSDEAAALAAEAEEAGAKLSDAPDPARADLLRDRAGLQASLNRLPEAEAALRQALEIAGKADGPDSVPVARLLMSLGHVLRLEGGPGAPEEISRRPVEIFRAALGDRHPALAVALQQLASAEVARGHVEEALRAYEEAEGILAGSLGGDAPNLAGILNDKALLLLEMKRTQEAEALFRRAVGLAEAGTRAQTPQLATLLANQALASQGLGRGLEAQRLKERSEAILTRVYGTRRPPASAYPTLPVWVREM